MRLLVHEIDVGGVYQSIIPNENKNISAIRPHLYIKNSPTGNLKVSITSPDGTVISESEEIVISSISSADEYHGYVTFYLNASLKAQQTYLIKVDGASGYSFDESAFCGVCGNYSLEKYQNVTPITSEAVAPLDFEIWTLSQK